MLNAFFDGIIAFTPYWKDIARKLGIKESLPIYVFPHGFDTNMYYPIPKDIARTYFKYDINDFPLSPFVNWEYFYDKTRDITYMDNEILITGGTSAIRSFGGFAVELPKSQTMELAIGRRKNYLSNQVNWIIDLNYSLSIK